MNFAPTLTAQEFKKIHNAVCELDSLVERLSSVIKPELYNELKLIRDNIRLGLAGAYKQDHEAFEIKHSHYARVGLDLGVNSTWSIYDVDNLTEVHPFKGADRVVYKNHWGPKAISVSINGQTWAALWRAADACIRDSGDDHHVYIEQFATCKNDPRTLFLYTGS